MAVTGLMLVVLAGFLYSLVRGRGRTRQRVVSGLEPRFDGADSLLLATGMLGATVMPHVIYLHGSLTQHRYARATEQQRLGLLRSQRLDVVTAMTLAGAVNIIMLVVAARVLSGGAEPVTTIEAAHAGLGAALGPTAAAAVRAGAARLRLRRVGGRDALGPGRDAGVPAAADPAGRCAGWSPWPPRWP